MSKEVQLQSETIFKWSQLGALCSEVRVYRYVKFEFRYLKNLKLFVKVFSSKTDLLVAQTGLKTQNWEGKSVFK